MNIKWWKLFSASIRAFAVFVALDLLLECLARSLFGLSVKHLIGIRSFGVFFTVTCFLLVYLGLLLILFVYTVIRPRFPTRLSAGMVTSGIFLVFSALQMTQLLNFGILSAQLYAVSAISGIIELPIVMLVGIASYGERQPEI